MKAESPIALFDSGVGGLTVFGELSKIMPDERLVYFGDTLRCPYGDRSVETIRKFSTEITDFLLKYDVKMIIAACNTVSAVALDAVKETAKNIPVIGVVESGCRAAVESSRAKKIGVIGTRATIGAGAYGIGIRAINPEISVYEKACPLLVHLVEDGEMNERIIDAVIEKYLSDLLALEIDSLVLACTHYPLLTNAFLRCVNNKVTLINGAEFTAKTAKKILAENGSLASSRIGDDILLATDVTHQFERLADVFLHGEKKKIEKVKL